MTGAPAVADEASTAGRSLARADVGRRLRIVIASLSYFPDHHDGASRLAYDEARYLAGLGHEVWLVAMAGRGGAPEHVVEGGLHVLRYRRPAWAAIDSGAHQRKVRSLLARYVGRDVDVVHAHTLLSGAAALGVYRRRARTCYSVHSPVKAELAAGSRGALLPERVRLRVAAVLRSRLEARVVADCDAVTCESEFTRRLVGFIHGPRLAARVRVAPGWVDPDRFRVPGDRQGVKQEIGWPLDRPVVFSLRRLVPRMGLDVLLEAAARLHASGRRFQLIVGGEGPEREVLEARAGALGLGAIVVFAGRVPDERLPSFYGAADACVVPTVELECFGLPVIEALACGCPVLATPVGALPEVLGPIEPAWLGRDADGAAMAELLASFLDGRLPEHRPEWLRDRVVARFGVGVCLPALADIALSGRVEA